MTRDRWRRPNPKPSSARPTCSHEAWRKPPCRPWRKPLCRPWPVPCDSGRPDQRFTQHRRRAISDPGREGQSMATQEQKTVAFVLYPGITLLDLVGPLQVFSSLRQFNDQYRPVVVAERIEPLPTDGPLTVTADQTFADVPDPAVVFVPGGDAPTIRPWATRRSASICATRPTRRRWSGRCA